MVCKPFYVGNIPYHIPDNSDITVTYNAGKVVQVQGCKALPTNVDPSVGPDSALMFQILTKYTKPTIAPQAFAQMGFLDGKFAVNALMSIKGAITAKSYNNAVRALTKQKSDILCKPFYVGSIPYHIPNNTNIIVDYKNKNVVVKKGCTAFEAVDKAISQTRKWEKQYKLN